MIIIGVDFHPEFQQIALLNTATGEVEEKRLAHPDEAEKFADFDPLVPHTSTNMSLSKILRTKQDGLPVLTFVYEKGPFVASITETMDRGYVDPGLRGIPVEIARDVKGRLSFCGAATALVFVRQGVAVSMLTTLPPHLALDLARTLAR